MKKIAFIGLGAMGERIATHILQAGHALTVFIRRIRLISGLLANKGM